MARRLLSDAHHAVRSLAKQPRFTLVAALTLALGVAAVTAIFSVVNAVLLRPLPYPNSDRLVNIWSHAPGLGYDQFPLSPDLFKFYKEHQTVFEDMALYQRRRSSIGLAAGPEVVDSEVVTATYFSMLGADFAAGRTFTAAEDTPSGARVVVVSHRLWQRAYSADPTLVGRPIRVNAEPVEVVGVAPAWMDRPESPDLWLTARFPPDEYPAGTFGWNAVARLKPDVTPAQASAHLEPLVKQAMAGIRSADYRAFLIDGRYRPLVHLMRDDVVGSAVEPLWILLGTVGIVLLIACGNVANLTLIRTDARQREIGVRLALGGSRATLIQSLLVEALVLAVAGASLGVLVAFIALPGLVSLAPATIPRLDEVRIDGVVLAAVAGVTLMAAIIVGLVPALRYTRPSVLGAIRQGGRGVTDHSTRQRGRSVLVAIQTALAMILLVGSGLLARSFMRMMDVDTGFEGRDLMTARVSLPAPSYPERADVTRVVRQIVERLAQLPGATGAAATSDPPIVGSVSGTAMDVEGRTVEPGRMPPIIQYQLVTPGYFAALRTSLQRGRDIDWHDTSGIVVNEVAAAELWPGQDPIGHRLRRSRGAEESPAPWFTVVGVVENIRQEGLRRPAPAQIYFPVHGAFNEVPRAMTCVIQGPATIVNADAVLRAVRAVDGNLPLASIQAMQDIVSDSVVEFSFTMLALGIAAAVALLLGAIGLYGVLAYAVSLQTRDIGLRLALGASPRQIMGSIVRRGVFISSIGLAAGSAGALALTRLLEGLLFETKPLDLPTFVATGTALLAVALAASYVPARRAATISPMESMRL